MSNIATQFKKGEINNPTGRPKGKSITTQLREALSNVPDAVNGKKNKETYQSLLVTKLLQLAIVKGDTKALQLIMNYIDGAPKQTLAVEDKRELTEEEVDELQEVNKIMYGETNIKKKKRITKKIK
jgi:hypothetical protein